MGKWAWSLLCVALLPAAAVRAVDEDQTLHFIETETTIELTVPAGGVWLVIPSEGFERLRPKESGVPGPRSFDLVNRARGIEILGAFDSATMYPGFRRFWTDELEAMRVEEAPEPKNILITQDGDWEIVAYDTERDGERKSHVRAQLVKDQVWIDVHVEAASSGRADDSSEEALEVVRSFAIRIE